MAKHKINLTAYSEKIYTNSQTKNTKHKKTYSMENTLDFWISKNVNYANEL